MPTKTDPTFDEDNPEWTAEMFARARGPADLPPNLLAAFPNTRTRGPQKAPRKHLTSLRIDPDILDHFRTAGPGWQSRINAALRRAIERKIA